MQTESWVTDDRKKNQSENCLAVIIHCIYTKFVRSLSTCLPLASTQATTDLIILRITKPLRSTNVTKPLQIVSIPF